MTKVVNRAPLARLSGKVAQPHELRAMTRAEVTARTCRHCRITYRAVGDASACRAWHEGRGL